jgi:1,4-dihydroxy-2-naphthoate polyprenyltransferase
MLLPAFSIGLLSAGVLNTNNIRDIDNDHASGKNTIVVKMGLANARIYHILLIGISFLCLLLFIVFTPLHWIQYLSLLAFYPIIVQAVKVQRMEPSPAFNALLRQLSIGTLLLVVVFVICQTIALGIYVSNMINQYLK